MIIEDEIAQQDAYKLKLGKKYQVVAVTTVNEALGQVAIFPPDLIILDIMLPGGKNGFDLLQTLKENPKTKLIPVIMITNLGEEEHKTALECGAVAYFTKTNIGLSEVEKVVEHYI